MAKGRSKSRSTRERNQFANQRLRSPFSVRPARITFPSLTSFEDFRRWEPKVLYGYPRTFPRALARFSRPRSRTFDRVRQMALPRMWLPVSTGMGFSQPSRVILCVRRHTRKQVLHAFRKTGRGGQNRPRFTVNSLVHC